MEGLWSQCRGLKEVAASIAKGSLSQRYYKGARNPILIIEAATVLLRVSFRSGASFDCELPQLGYVLAPHANPKPTSYQQIQEWQCLIRNRILLCPR